MATGRYRSNGSSAGAEERPVNVPWGSPEARTGERVTARARRIAEGLPQWDPLPPGEITVHRPRGQ